MKKDEILTKLKYLKEELKLEDFIVLSGASMVLQGIKKQTTDIDISVPKSIYKKLESSWTKDIGAFGIEILKYDNIELSYNLYYPKDTIIIEGYKVLNIPKMLEIKLSLNRKKDKKDIGLLNMALAKNDKYIHERALYEAGYNLSAGVDEVGRGPLVGPVVAAACILPKNCQLEGLNDSKALTEKKREELYPKIIEECIAYGIGVIDAKTIDEVNIYEASKLAMIEAIKNLQTKPDYVLVDAMKLNIDIPTEGLVHGDYISASIGAASIIAKVTRDNMMYELDKKYPMYGFKNHKGYPTKEHLDALEKYGPLDNYRFSYGPVKKYKKSKEEVNEVHNKK